MEVENGDELDANPEFRDAVALARRVNTMLDSKALIESIDPKELEADEYDGEISVAEWLRRKGGKKRRRPPLED